MNIRYGYDIRGEVVGEDGTAALGEREPGRGAPGRRRHRPGARRLAGAVHPGLRRRAAGVGRRGAAGTGGSARAPGTATRPRWSPTPRCEALRTGDAQSPVDRCAERPTSTPVTRGGRSSEARARPVHVPRRPADSSCPGWWPISATSTSSCHRGRTSLRSSCTRGPNRDTVRQFKAALDAAGRAGRDAPAAVPLVGAGRGRAAGRRALLEARDRAHRRPRLPGDELRVQRPARAGRARSEAQFWRSMEELLPVFEREGMELRLEPHPDDFVEDGRVGGRHGPRHRHADWSRSSTARRTPSTRAATSPGSWSTPATCSPTCTSPTRSTTGPRRGLRYIVNPPGSTARVHQHLDIGQGEVDWDEFFGTLGELGFGGGTRRS